MMKAEHHCSALWSHSVACHGYVAGEGAKAVASNMYGMKITANYSSSTRRLISEALQIETEVQRREVARERGEEVREVLNSVRQWYQPGMIRVRARRNVEY